MATAPAMREIRAKRIVRGSGVFGAPAGISPLPGRGDGLTPESSRDFRVHWRFSLAQGRADLYNLQDIVGGKTRRDSLLWPRLPATLPRKPPRSRSPTWTARSCSAMAMSHIADSDQHHHQPHDVDDGQQHSSSSSASPRSLLLILQRHVPPSPARPHGSYHR